MLIDARWRWSSRHGGIERTPGTWRTKSSSQLGTGPLIGPAMESTDAVFAAFEMTFNGGLRDHDHQPYYSGRRRRRGMNVQIVADAAGRPVWASAAPPGCAHDLTAARTRGTWKILTKLRCGPPGRPQWRRPSSFSTTSRPDLPRRKRSAMPTDRSDELSRPHPSHLRRDTTRRKDDVMSADTRLEELGV